THRALHSFPTRRSSDLVSMIKNTKKEALQYVNQPYYKTFIQGLIIGTITGIIGAGGGFLYVPALVLWANLPMKKAVGTSLVIIRSEEHTSELQSRENLV